MKRRYFIVVLLMALCLTACGQKAETTPGTWQDQYDLGIKYLSDGDYEEAIIAFTAAIEIDPKQAAAYIGRADAYVSVSETLDAEEAWEEFLEQLQKAEEDYLEAIKLDKKAVDTYQKLADVYLAMGEPGKAAEILAAGYEATGDEGLAQRLETVEILPTELDTGSIVVSMYEPDGYFCGHDAYTFDDNSRMTSNTWYDPDNTVVYREVWTYDDASNTTKVVRQEQNEEGTGLGTTEETFDGCENQGWFWLDMGDFITDPTLDAVDGIATPDEGRYAVYGYDARGRVSSIHTYDTEDSLLGYCMVSYAN